ncbi:MAG: hypothetical protein AAGJ95_16385 [Cyanobacteria bacterium J06554_11]
MSNFQQDSQSSQRTTLLKLADETGFSCYRDEHNKWRIEPKGEGNNWYLVEADGRWLLVIDQVPQIFFRPAGAIAFLQRWLGE